MSSRTIILLAFGCWSLFCSWWYVCKIKDVCTPREKIQQAATPPTPEPIEQPSASTAEAQAPAAAPQENSIKTETVSVVEDAQGAEINFPYNSTEKEANEAIDDYLTRLANQLLGSGASVTISGHTDGIGDAKTNFAFAERRAKTIRDILVKKGVKRSQITTKSYGETRPKASNDTPEGRYKNRRVEITINN